jgi:hypothetical protein
LLLEVICSGQLKHEQQIGAFVDCTLMNWQFGEDEYEAGNAIENQLVNRGPAFQSKQMAFDAGTSPITASTNSAAPATAGKFSVRAGINSAVSFLRASQFVLQTLDGSLHISQLGMATARSGLAPSDALYVFDYVQQARSCLILKGNSFHCVFLVTPVSQNSVSVVPWTDLETIYHAVCVDYPVSTFFSTCTVYS